MKIDKKAFTLIELLVTISIIITLMGLTIRVIGNAMYKSKLSSAKIMISKLETAVKRYHDAFGVYPPDLTYKYLGGPVYSPEGGRLDPVLSYESGSCKREVENDINTSYYVDPWDNPYVLFFVDMCDDKFYQMSGVEKKNTFPKNFYERQDEEGRNIDKGYVGWAIQQYQFLVGNIKTCSSFLEKNNLIDQVVDPDSINYNSTTCITSDKFVNLSKLATYEEYNDVSFILGTKPSTKRDVISNQFLIWSMGPDIISGTEDDIGNWGLLRNKLM